MSDLNTRIAEDMTLIVKGDNENILCFEYEGEHLPERVVLTYQYVTAEEAQKNLVNARSAAAKSFAALESRQKFSRFSRHNIKGTSLVYSTTELKPNPQDKRSFLVVGTRQFFLDFSKGAKQRAGVTRVKKSEAPLIGWGLATKRPRIHALKLRKTA